MLVPSVNVTANAGSVQLKIPSARSSEFWRKSVDMG